MANSCFGSLLAVKDETCAKPEFDETALQSLIDDINEEIAYDDATHFHGSDPHWAECDLAFRWAIPTGAIARLALKHDVKIRAVGREDGCGFIQVVCVDVKGDILQDAGIDYLF
jgi:hypothetical protein